MTRSGTAGATNSAANRATVGVLVVLGLLLTAALISGNSARTGPAFIDLPANREAVSTPLGPADTTRVRVPSIGLDTTRLTELGLNEDRTLEVPSDAATVGWYGRGAAPGEDGPAVYASHVNFRGQPGGFAALSDVEAGDQILVDRADGVTVAFIVDRVRQVPKGDFPTATVYGPTVGPGVRLITCGGEYDSAVRSYEDNIVVFGQLQEAYRL